MPDVDKLIVDNVVFSDVTNSGKTSESVCANIRYLAKCILDADEKAVFSLGYGGGTARNVAIYLRRAFENAEGIHPKP
ncbi:hypothetical protein G6L32_07380 [Agrobacterium tumefaciens]|uniref:hypothetical protein n=1 Tax=Agrobacterium tumefaciens TaxID=358 RepID=UPI001572CCC4|nr:hypothetical protein [Agrobacterium tumefaciens]